MSERERRHREGPMSRFEFLMYAADAPVTPMGVIMEPSDKTISAADERFARIGGLRLVGGGGKKK